jgi:hypothetical protein
MRMPTHQPTYRAFTVVKREGADDWWIPIGAAFPHHSGDGFNVVLQALPIPGGDGVCKIVLRPPRGDDDQQSQEPTDQTARDNKSGSRRR